MHIYIIRKKNRNSKMQFEMVKTKQEILRECKMSVLFFIRHAALYREVTGQWS
jgi:hypothetical protein